MKRYTIVLIVFFVCAFAFAQDTNVVTEKNGDLVEATYYYEDGSIQQKGTFKDGKLHGTWKLYDAEGNKIAVGNYLEGKKEGKWFFWTEDSLKEVDYIDSKIVSVNEWNDKTRVAIRNK